MLKTYAIYAIALQRQSVSSRSQIACLWSILNHRAVCMLFVRLGPVRTVRLVRLATVSEGCETKATGLAFVGLV